MVDNQDAAKAWLAMIGFADLAGDRGGQANSGLASVIIGIASSPLVQPSSQAEGRAYWPERLIPSMPTW